MKYQWKAVGDFRPQSQNDIKEQQFPPLPSPETKVGTASLSNSIHPTAMKFHATIAMLAFGTVVAAVSETGMDLQVQC